MHSSHVVKTVSRAAAKKRSGKMRVVWFVVGTSFGIGCTSMITSLLTSTSVPVQTAEIAAPAPVVAASAQPLPGPVPVAEPAAKEVALLMPESKADPVAVLAAEAPAVKSDDSTYPIAFDLKVENGDTLINMLTDTGVSYDEAQNAIDSLRKVYDPKKLGVGDKIAVEIDKPKAATAPVIASMMVPVSLTSKFEITRTKDDDFMVRKVEAPTERKVARSGGPITSSLYETGVKTGISASLLNELITAYSYDVDFQRDIQPGNTIDVLYERVQTEDGTLVGQGNMIYSQLDLGDRILRLYRYVDSAGSVDYYTPTGESVRKALMRTPINGAKITSGFGMRNHPILGFTKMHRGIDFAAPTGTPIYAAGDGVVEVEGQKGGYGNYLRIRHNNKYSSAYAHLSRFASGIAPGKKVKQGQIVAYVGTTGQSTGPHLHYEILVGNEQVNPSNVKFKNGNVLGGKELAAFKKTVAKIESTLASMPRGTTLAMADARELGITN